MCCNKLRIHLITQLCEPLHAECVRISLAACARNLFEQCAHIRFVSMWFCKYANHCLFTPFGSDRLIRLFE